MKHVTKTETKTYREVAKAAALCRRQCCTPAAPAATPSVSLPAWRAPLDHFKSGCAANFGPPHRAAARDD